MKALPDRPQFLREVAAIPVEDGILLEGLGQQQLIQGPVAQTILPLLIEMLDGRHTIRDMEDELDSVPPGYIRQAVALLQDWGLIEGPSGMPLNSNLNGDTLSHLKRIIAAQGMNFEAQHAYANLVGISTLIIANGSSLLLADKLKRLLSDAGVSSVFVGDREELSTSTSDSKTLVIALSIDGEADECFNDLEKLRTKGLVSWLRIIFNRLAGYVDVGPLFMPSVDTCYSCLSKMHVPLPTTAPTTIAGEDLDLWSARISNEILNVLALGLSETSARQFRRIKILDETSRTLYCARLPCCEVCFEHPLISDSRHVSGTQAFSAITNPAFLYEEYLAAHVSRGELLRKTTEWGQGTKTTDDSGEILAGKRIPLYRGRVNLDRPILRNGIDIRALFSQRLSAKNLATILSTTVGIRSSEESTANIRRWTPTAGNLGSVSLLVICHSVSGINPGVYRYSSSRHELVEYEPRNLAARSKLLELFMGESGDLPAAIIITVGALEKVSRKYGDFAFRLVNSDAGVAYSQLLLAAEHQRVRAAKINVRLGPEMADRLSLRFPTELPTMAVGLYDSKISLDSRLNRSFENYVIPSKSFWTAAEAFYGLDYHDVAQIQTERSDSFNTAYTDKLYCPVQATLVQPEPTSIVLPRPSSRRTTLGEALLRRKSIRSFSDRAVSLEDISSVLNYASSSHRSGRRDKTECKGMISYTILASRVLRTADGVYKYQPEVHQLVKQKPSLSKEQTNSLFIQEGPANAPVIIWLSGRFAQVTLDDGAHGYHQMLQKAGEVAHRLSLAALACGLDGCIIAGIVTAKARALLGIDGLTSLSLLAFIMGYRD